MTFTDYKWRRNRIWIKEEVWVDDKHQFMDQLVGKIEAIFSQEPVDIYVLTADDKFMPKPHGQKPVLVKGFPKEIAG